MSDKKQSETEQPRQQNKVWPRVKGIIWPWFKGIIWIIMIALGGLSLFICWFYLSPERRAANDHTALILYLIGLAAIGVVVLCIPQIITSNPKKYFITSVLVAGITGGVFALLLPIAVKSTTTGVGGLRHSILLATGGLLAILTLGETRRKNDNDIKAANELQIRHEEKLGQQEFQFKMQLKEQQKQFDASAFKERKAERRERYTKAVEQLGSKEASVRMGGVYTLVGLVDEWLEEESIEKYEDRLKEGQVIINNLCAYIRSPFTLATQYNELDKDSPTSDGVYKDNQQEFYTDKAEFKAEADVRIGIIKEIHSHLRGAEINTPGEWSDFEYDFSGSTFFYPVDFTKSYYKKPVNFSGSTYKGGADFSNSTYQGKANFSGSTYQEDVTSLHSIYNVEANFAGSTYQGQANFSGSIYKNEANFSGSVYEKGVIFSASKVNLIFAGEVDYAKSTYQGRANFSDSIYKDWAIFSDSTYQGGADFSNSTYKNAAHFNGSTYKTETEANFSNSTYEGWGQANFYGSIYEAEANFSGSIYEKDVTFSVFISRSIYVGRANFSRSIYQEGGAEFSNSTYKDTAHFHDSIYVGRANFSDSIYEDVVHFRNSTYKSWADFRGSIFYSGIYFGQDGDNGSFSRFTDCAPEFYDEKSHKNALFGSHNDDFTVDTSEGYPINLNSEGLPLDCKFLTSEQKEYLADKFQEIEETNNKLLEAKDLKEKAELLKNLQALNEELHEWREEATTVKVEGTTSREEDN